MLAEERRGSKYNEWRIHNRFGFECLSLSLSPLLSRSLLRRLPFFGFVFRKHVLSLPPFSLSAKKNLVVLVHSSRNMNTEYDKIPHTTFSATSSFCHAASAAAAADAHTNQINFWLLRVRYCNKFTQSITLCSQLFFLLLLLHLFFTFS